MADSNNALPQQIIETSRAFAETLEMENRVFQGQINSAIGMTLNAVKELIVLCKEAVAIGNTDISKEQQNLANTAQQALSDVQQAGEQAAQAKAVTTSIASDAPADTLDQSAVHAVSISYENAVSAQNNMYITQQAAATQIISTILSVATATIAVAVKNAETPAQ